MTLSFLVAASHLACTSSYEDDAKREQASRIQQEKPQPQNDNAVNRDPATTVFLSMVMNGFDRLSMDRPTGVSTEVTNDYSLDIVGRVRGRVGESVSLTMSYISSGVDLTQGCCDTDDDYQTTYDAASDISEWSCSIPINYPTGDPSREGQADVTVTADFEAFDSKAVTRAISFKLHASPHDPI